MNGTQQSNKYHQTEDDHSTSQAATPTKLVKKVDILGLNPALLSLADAFEPLPLPLGVGLGVGELFPPAPEAGRGEGAAVMTVNSCPPKVVGVPCPLAAKVTTLPPISLTSVNVTPLDTVIHPVRRVFSPPSPCR